VNVRSHRLFARLALLAALLLATVPTLGRLLGEAHASPHAMAMPMAMAPMDHAMATMAHGARGVSHEPAQGGAPHAGHDHEGDCAYCPLLGSVLTAQTLAFEIPSSLLPRHAARTDATPARVAHLRGTLGSRGPPRAA